MLSILLIVSSLFQTSYSYSFVPTRGCHNIPTFSSYSSSTTSTSTSIIQRHNFLEMKVSKGKSKHSKGNSLHSINQNRKRIAGRPGTKHFLDPNKVFIGNLSYDATEDDVRSFLKKNLGGLHTVESIKIIVDWKTNKSKGFGFVQFIEPMFATSAMESIKNKKLKGRIIRLDQGRKKDALDKRVLFVKKRERREDEESKVIDGALDEAEGKVMGKAKVDVDVEAGTDLEYSLDDFEDDEDEALFEDDEDDEDSEFDGWFEEVYGGSKWEELSDEEAKDMNREQRREAQRLKPRRKLPRKGFGVQDP